MLNIAGVVGLQRNMTEGEGSVSNSELREIKLKLALKDREVKELKEELAEAKKTGVKKSSNFDELQNERDQLVMKIE